MNDGGALPFSFFFFFGIASDISTLVRFYSVQFVRGGAEQKSSRAKKARAAAAAIQH